MPYFLSFTGTSTEKLKVNADKDYYQECVEIGYRYLSGSDGCNKSLTDALKYLSSVVKNKTAMYHLEATLLYVKASLEAYLEDEGNSETSNKKLQQATEYLMNIIKDDKFNLAPAEQIILFELLSKICNKSKDIKPLESYLKNCFKFKKSFLACHQLANLYAQGSNGFKKSPKAAIAYYVQSLFLDEDSCYSEQSAYGKSRTDYANNVFKPLAKDISIACLSITVLALLHGDKYSTLKKTEIVKVILELDFIKEHFKFQKNIRNSSYSTGSIKISDSYPTEKSSELLRLALLSNPYATVSMANFCYKEGLINQDLFSQFLKQASEPQLSSSSSNYISTPASQVDKLRVRFFANKYLEYPLTNQTPSERCSLLIELAISAMLLEALTLKPQQYSLIATLVMELIVTNDPDCIAHALKIYQQFGDKINTFSENFKEKGLKFILENKEKQLNAARWQIVGNTFKDFKTHLNECSSQGKAKPIVPKAIQNILEALKKPVDDYMSQDINSLFNEEKLKALYKDIELINNEFKTIKTMINNLDPLRQYLDPESYKKLIQEIETAKTAYQKTQDLKIYLGEFAKTLKELNNGGWKNKAVEIIEAQQLAPEDNKASLQITC